MPYRIKYIWSLIKVNHCKEHLVGILLRISPGIGKDGILIVSFSAKKTTDWELLFVNHVVIIYVIRKLQWGTKVLTHFRKMAPFCTVDILIPFPCLPQPLTPKINVEFWTLKSFFYFRQHWFGGSGDLWRLKEMK